MSARFARLGVGIVAALVVAAAPAAAQLNGMLGIFFDEYGSQCSASISPGGVTQAYVVFLPDGETRTGITGAEFRIEMQDADGYNVLAWQSLLPVALGDPFADKVNVATGECLTGLAIPLLTVQIQNISGGSNAKLVVKVGEDPSKRDFPCALVTLCDTPIHTPVCALTGKAVINPTGGVECGSNSESAEWSRIKGLYR
jgi:hypothetical protein